MEEEERERRMREPKAAFEGLGEGRGRSRQQMTQLPFGSDLVVHQPLEAKIEGEDEQEDHGRDDRDPTTAG
jgi:hypothetical protein